MQLIPSTARRFGVRDVFNPAENVEGGVRYLRHLLDLYDNPALSLAAYNAGEGAVDRFGGVPPYSETRQFVRRVNRLYQSYNRVLTPPAPAPPPKKHDGPRIYYRRDAAGIVHYATDLQ
jgi:soluble lytic murein transglycosylase-like protein